MVLFIGVVSCGTYRYIYFDLKEAPHIEKVFLVSINYQNITGETNRTFYPYSDFMLEPFLDGLIDEFNSNDYNVQITSWPDLTLDKRLDQIILSNGTSIVNYQTAFLPERLSTWKKIRPYHKIVKADYYLSLDLNLSAGKQEVTGYFKLRGTNQMRRIIWREQLLHQSPYIDNDPDSPYISKNQQIDYPAADKNSYHYLESIKSFNALGKSVAQSLKETLTDIKED